MRNVSLQSLYEGRKRSLSFGCPLLDEITGGISRGIVTELCGEAGSGKTQICLKLSLQAQLSPECGGLGGKVAYISCGEGEFPVSRLNQLAEKCESNFGIAKRDLMSGVLIEKSFNTEDLLHSLTKQLPKMCTENNIKLVIIDSLAGIVRTEYNPQETDDMVSRSELYFQLSQKLKWLSHTHSLCIVVVNQVSSTIDESNSISSLSNPNTSLFHRYSYQEIDEGEYSQSETGRSIPLPERGNLLPALGLAWAHCINTRIMLYRDTTVMRTVSSNIVTEEEAGENEDVFSTSIRRMSLQCSPYLPHRECQFVITSSGVYGVGVS